MCIVHFLVDFLIHSLHYTDGLDAAANSAVEKRARYRQRSSSVGKRRSRVGSFKKYKETLEDEVRGIIRLGIIKKSKKKDNSFKVVNHVASLYCIIVIAQFIGIFMIDLFESTIVMFMISLLIAIILHTTLWQCH